MRELCLAVLTALLIWGCQSSNTENQPPQPEGKGQAVGEALCGDSAAAACPAGEEELEGLRSQVAGLARRVEQQDKQLTELKSALGAKKAEAAPHVVLKTRQLQLMDEDGLLRLALKPSASRGVALEFYGGGDDPTHWVELVAFFESVSLVRDLMRQMPGLPGVDEDTDFGLLEPTIDLLPDPTYEPLLEPEVDPVVKSVPRSDYSKIVRQMGPWEYEILVEGMRDATADLNVLGRQARVIPNYKDGKYQGFKLVGVRPGSLYRALGIRSGDVIVKINGRVLDSPNRALELFSALKDEVIMVLELSRRGKPVTIKYNMVDQFSGPGWVAPGEEGNVVEAGTMDPALELARTELQRKAEQFEMAVRKVGANEYQILSSGLKGLTPEVVTYSGTRIIPNYRDGVHAGFKLIGIRPGGVFRTMGLRSGDVVQEMGGMPLNSPTALVDALQLLFDGQPQRVTFTLSRRGKPVKMTYTIVHDSAGDEKEEEPEKKKETPVVIKSGD